MMDAAAIQEDTMEYAVAVPRAPYLAEGGEVHELEPFEGLPPEAQDIWLGAVGGVPVHERTRIAQECVVGEKKKDALRLLKSFSRVDERLVRTRLSHISEGHYDVNGDVVRPLNSKSKGEDEMEVTDEASCSFRRISAEMAKNAKANVRRRQPEEDDI
ncbi:unnamed protein product [Effrenium voratum]|nr:unnamed protein product [Effrenium voratum]